MRFLFSATVLFCAMGTALAQEAKPPTSPTAKKAKAAYEAELTKLEKGFEAAVKRYEAILEKERAKAKAKYVEQLDFARKNALIKNDLDEAQRLAEAKKAVEGANEEPAARGKSKQPWFVGTEWAWKASDGTPRHVAWLPSGYLHKNVF